MTELLAWARANPIWARLWIKLGVRLPLALALVMGLQAAAALFDLSSNGAAIIGVVVAVWAGGRIAERLCAALVIPAVPG